MVCEGVPFVCHFVKIHTRYVEPSHAVCHSEGTRPRYECHHGLPYVERTDFYKMTNVACTVDRTGSFGMTKYTVVTLLSRPFSHYSPPFFPPLPQQERS